MYAESLWGRERSKRTNKENKMLEGMTCVMPSTRDIRQSLVVVMGVGLRRFGVVMIRVRMMRMGKVGMMTGFFVVTGAAWRLHDDAWQLLHGDGRRGCDVRRLSGRVT
jgi:hypothetical protein